MSSKTLKSTFEQVHNPHKPSYKAALSNIKKDWTVSVAIPGSIIYNAQNFELKTYLAGQIARTCAIFSVSEIVIYNDLLSPYPTGNTKEDPHAFLSLLLEYLETPQYLRKALFPLQPALKLAGLLPPLDCPHHLRKEDTWEANGGFREGVVVGQGEESKKRKRGEDGDEESVMVEVGLDEPVLVTAKKGKLPPTNTRVTVQRKDGKLSLCSPTTPAVYWGYTVRYAPSLSAVFSGCPYRSKKGKKESTSSSKAEREGYDLLIGTSERGRASSSVINDLPRFKHALMTFGPVSGLEVVIEKDGKLGMKADKADNLFDFWVNVVEGQGSRTVRTEEALMIALSVFKDGFESFGKSV
ncbi:DUF171-domain-containing protein [Atractiella rhizophila]|nr:DUF171-domain-containing protein [Atractiella rhizophila]